MKRCPWLLVLLMVASATANAAELTGAQAFIACQGCHSLAAEDGHAVGPNLSGLDGRVAGTQEGFAYSPALQASQITWTGDTLKAWVLAAEGMAPGTWMLYHNHLEADEVDRLVTYILRH